MLYHTVRYCTAPCCTIPYSTRLYCTILYSTYCTILCYSIIACSFSNMACCAFSYWCHCIPRKKPLRRCIVADCMKKAIRVDEVLTPCLLVLAVDCKACPASTMWKIQLAGLASEQPAGFNLARSNTKSPKLLNNSNPCNKSKQSEHHNKHCKLKQKTRLRARTLIAPNS